ncbi:TetR/AcrR family transcriptional regulator [Nocardioides flavescens]|uniref:TetR family transcriptional regulator n=1 Tax=Nocardioides flavescens TaxID=2691959 RepID=A0A6L7ELJ6_9ACTN|nr:TetR/AcrR family transcriptional regulator [Nocardioides flavescens]MXG88187.1 TetR family transcriptional regulator [Nocardioides flavescens]
MTPAETAAVSRPRVEGDREVEILSAALRVLADVGYDRLTMDAVAQAAKASKATLYRRWSSKARLVIDALEQGHAHPDTFEAPVDTGTLRGDLIATFCAAGGLTDKPEVDAFAAIMTAIAIDPEFAAAFRSEILAPKVAATTALFERARTRGEIGQGVDIELLAPALAAVVMHRFFLMGQPPTRDIVVRVIDQIILPAAHAAD